MLNYDFSALNDKEFENLCIDLISSDWNDPKKVDKN